MFCQSHLISVLQPPPPTGKPKAIRATRGTQQLAHASAVVSPSHARPSRIISLGFLAADLPVAPVKLDSQAWANFIHMAKSPYHKT